MSGSCRRVAIVSHSRARVGGVETYLASIVPALVRAGHDVGCWFETAGAGADPVIDANHGVESWVASPDGDGGLADLAAWKPDVVYGHGSCRRYTSARRCGSRLPCSSRTRTTVRV